MTEYHIPFRSQVTIPEDYVAQYSALYRFYLAMTTPYTSETEKLDARAMVEHALCADEAHD